jgi:two-component system cell cycle sensor histidine kinase/response regulator CckA
MAKKVLVVEDTDSVRMLIRRQLTAAGFDVLVAESGDEALQLLAGSEARVELVITDLRMPGMDGEQLGAKLQANAESPAVLYMSAYPPPTGLDHFIQKPFTLDALTAAARAVLAT